MLASSWTPVISFCAAGLVLLGCNGDDSTGPGGALHVLIETSGETVDDDGYLLIVDGSDSLSVETNDSLSLASLTSDTVQLHLSHVAPNCSVAGANPRTVAVESAGQLVAFQVGCIFAIHNQIVVASDLSGNMEIIVMNPDGSAVTQLTNSDSLDWEPTISPDGTKIAFSSRREGAVGSYDIFVMSSNGEGPVTNITNNPASDRHPSWSPQGDRIVFTSDRDGDTEIYSMNVDGSNLVQLTTNNSDDGTASWSPSGDRIVFASNREGLHDIFVMNADGTAVNRLTSTSSNWDPSYSPDGNSIAFVTDRYGVIAIAVMNTAGTAVTRLTDRSSAYYPSWAPDGARISFSSYATGLDLFVMNADGSGVTNVTQSQYDYFQPIWSPW